jgi:hypothetical protein
MIGQETLLVTRVRLVNRIPLVAPIRQRKSGRPATYPDRLFLQALVIMVVWHLYTVHELLSVLSEPTAEMQTLRSLLTNDDLEIAAGKLAPNSAAMLLLWENLWVAGLRKAIEDAGGQLVDRAQIAPEVVDEFKQALVAE